MVASFDGSLLLFIAKLNPVLQIGLTQQLVKNHSFTEKLKTSQLTTGIG